MHNKPEIPFLYFRFLELIEDYHETYKVIYFLIIDVCQAVIR